MIESSPSFTWLRQMLRKYSETIFNIKLISSGIDIPIIKIRFPWNCLCDGNIHSGKITSLYWNGFQEVDLRMFLTFWFITYSCWIVLKKTCPFQSRMNIWLMVILFDNLVAWQWAETLVEIRGTLADIGELPNRGADTIFPNINLTGLYV